LPWTSSADTAPQLAAALDNVFAEAQLKQADRDAGQESLFGEAAPTRHGALTLPEVEPWTEAERLAREKEVIGSSFRAIRSSAIAKRSPCSAPAPPRPSDVERAQVSTVVVVTAIKRQISKKTGAEYARLTLEDFHGTAEALVFPKRGASCRASSPLTRSCC